MTDSTINSEVTMGGAEATLLAHRYRVVRQLGQGGMGSVWLAEDTQLDNWQVAIKMLPSVLVSNKRAYNQLKSEALVSLKLTHPNIAAVRAFEENNGNPFLVVDYIDGITLDDYLADISGRADLRVGRDGARPSQVALPESEVIRLLTPIAAALDYAHSKGVIHRDVKPGNVMIAKDGTPYVLDFGIAREIQETMTGVTGKRSSGTLMYMSPEQLNGDTPSAAQDVYSFAAMAYECLTGAPPFSRGSIEYQIVNKPPAPLAPVFIKCGPGIMAGLEKKSKDRPANCAAVLSGGTRSVASDNGRARTPAAPREPRRLGVVAALSALAILVIGGFGYLLGRHPGDAVRTPRPHGVATVSDVTNPKPGDTKTVTLPAGAKLELVYCPPGSFTMGSPTGEEGRHGDETQHCVTLTKGFWIGKCEVTQRQWESVMGSNPSYYKGENRPVENVSWEDCQQFCRKAGLGLRLPTEAEWEYACRAKTTTPYAGTGRLDDMGWYRDNSGSTTHNVGTKQSNAWGIYDMHGNVLEWCSDWYGAYRGAAPDPTGPESGGARVFRGGSWSDNAGSCCSAIRDGNDPCCRNSFLGFRVCCSAEPSEWGSEREECDGRKGRRRAEPDGLRATP